MERWMGKKGRRNRNKKGKNWRENEKMKLLMREILIFKKMFRE